MLDKKLTIYKSLDLQKPAIPPRSHLYHLEPFGVGTPYVESLTGYIARLAEAHCIPTGRLISRELLPLILEGYADEVYDATDLKVGATGSRTLNGMESRTGRVVQALEAQTLRRDLRFLTMLIWTDVLPSRGLLRPVKAWCPVCYEEWRVLGQIVYEPLIWALNAVTLCLNHSLRLQTECTFCHQQLPLLTSCARPGYCSKCQEWLGISSAAQVSDSEVLSKNELNWQSWVVNNIGELFITAPCLPSAPLRERVTKNIVACVHQINRGNVSEFGRLLGLPQPHVRQYYVGATIPQSSTILLLCYRLGISLLGFLTQDFVVKNFCELTTLLQEQQKFQPRRKFDTVIAKSVLQAALNELPPPPLQEVAERLGRSRQLLYDYFPDLSRAISSRWVEYKQKCLEEAQRSLEVILKSDTHPPPSMREVARRLAYSSDTLRKHFPKLTSAISERYARYRKERAVERKEQLRQEVRQAAIELHTKGINPLAWIVGKFLNKPGIMRDKERVAALYEIRRELGYEK